MSSLTAEFNVQSNKRLDEIRNICSALTNKPLKNAQFPYEQINVFEYVYCFYADQILEVLSFRELAFEGEDRLGVFLSLQEMLLWFARGTIHMECFDDKTLTEADDYSLPFTYVSYYTEDNSVQNRSPLHLEVIEALRSLDHQLIWIDFSCLLQPGIDTGNDMEYNLFYLEEMKVKIPLIIKKAHETKIILPAVVLPQPRKQPKIQTHFTSLLTIFDQLKAFLQVKNRDDQDGVMSVLESKLQRIQQVHLPVHQWFLQLWCCYERLAMKWRRNGTFLYEGGQWYNVDLEEHLDDVKTVFDIFQRQVKMFPYDFQQLHTLNSCYYNYLFSFLHAFGYTVEVIKQFPFPFQFINIDDCIFCFAAKDISTILNLRKCLVNPEELPPHLSLQEMLMWTGRGIIDLVCYDFESVINSPDYSVLFSFVSHMQGTYPDKLGPQVISSFDFMGDSIIWLDLCSMFQGGVTTGHDYALHTRPVVEKLHVIMKKASRAFIPLNDTFPDHPRYDPLQIKFKLNKIQDSVQQICLTLREKSHEGDHLLSQVEEAIRSLANDWCPVNEYFGRLWCYVERLAMNPEEITVYHPHPIKIHADRHIQQVELLCKFMENAHHLARRNLLPSELVQTCRFDIRYESFSSLCSCYLFSYLEAFGGLTPRNRFCPAYYSLPKVLGPFAQVELLECFDSNDRLIVARIESKLRREAINEKEWLGALNICYIPEDPITRLRLLPTVIEISDMKLIRSWIRQAMYCCNNVLHHGFIEKDVLYAESFPVVFELDGSYQITLRVRDVITSFMFHLGSTMWTIGIHRYPIERYLLENNLCCRFPKFLCQPNVAKFEERELEMRELLDPVFDVSTDGFILTTPHLAPPFRLESECENFICVL
jgi:hypothetical protein